MPGASGLDDAIQVLVEVEPGFTGSPYAGETRLYSYLRDEMGTVVGIVAEEETPYAEGLPPLPVRYLYTPYGEAHAEVGPEVRRAAFDAEVTTVAGVEQASADPRTAAAGGIVVDFSIELDPASLAAGVVVEHLDPGVGWSALAGVRLDQVSGGDVPQLRVMPEAGWPRGESFRVRLGTALIDVLGRSLGGEERLEFRVPVAPEDPEAEIPPVVYTEVFSFRFESFEAARETLGGRFPGGQNALFAGAWVDPVVGVSYLRARWLDTRNAVFLTEDPMLDADSTNYYAYVGWGPSMAIDPFGLESFGEFAERYAVDAYGDDDALKWVAAFGLQALHATFEVASVGAVGKIDRAQEQLDRGQITRGQYWKQSGVAVAQTAASYAGGLGGGALGARAGIRLLGARGVTGAGVRAIGAMTGAGGSAGSMLAMDVVGIAAGTQEGLSSGKDYLSSMVVGGSLGALSAIPRRLAQDSGVNPSAPKPLRLQRSVGRASHNRAVRADIRAARAEGASAFRVNQQQVTASGGRVGINRPDLSYTRELPRRWYHFGRARYQRVHVEYDAPPASRAVPHALRLLSNDPTSKLILRTLP